VPAEHVAAVDERAAPFAGGQHVHQPLARCLHASISAGVLVPKGRPYSDYAAHS